jgi:excisionase family DNA binding protein
MAHDLISTKEAAKVIGYDDDSIVRRHCREGRIPSVSVGGMYLIRRRDAEKFRKPKRGPRYKSKVSKG